ncbi:MAG: hypothetical protein JNL82_10055 [Myxococcales bacterium]|nr:hypothetical protein [Myxococcales bacterium]
MNAPKKPGTDLNALKARLAKKGGDAPAAAAPAAPAAPAPAAAAPKAAPPRPGVKKPPADPNFIPAPGEQSPPALDLPPPGEVALPIDIPAPGEVSRPASAPVAAAAPPAKKVLNVDPDAAPFGADIGGGFDPNAGVIGGGDVGEIQQRGNKGLVALAAGAALILGVVVGYLFNQISSKGAQVKAGKDKGAVMFTEAQAVANMRKDISLKIDDIGKNIVAKPDEAAKTLEELNKTAFEKTPNVETLFGWQLAAINADGIRKTFLLYNEASGLRVDLGYLTGFVAGNVQTLANGGPRVFAVMFKGKGAVLVERLEPMCGDPKAPAACASGKEGEAIGFNVRVDPNAAPAFAALGSEDGQIQPLLPDGGVYLAAIGSSPEANAQKTAGILFARVKERLEAMSKAEGRALKALQKYSDDPNVDGPAGDLED